MRLEGAQPVAGEDENRGVTTLGGRECVWRPVPPRMAGRPPEVTMGKEAGCVWRFARSARRSFLMAVTKTKEMECVWRRKAPQHSHGFGLAATREEAYEQDSVRS